MSKRPEDRPENDRKNERRSVVEDLARARAARMSSGGGPGLQAMALPLALGGCLAVGYFGGAWLDAKFGTSFWMPIGVLIGLAAGFRETVLTIKRLNKQSWMPKNGSNNQASSSEYSKNSSLSSAQQTSEPARPKPKLFHVPEPPLASFEQKPGATASQTPNLEESDETEEDIIERLLGERPPELRRNDEAEPGQDEPEQRRPE